MNDAADPTDEDLALIKACPDPQAWFAAIKRLWWEPMWGWSEVNSATGRIVMLEISTGGWSGNEALIVAMQQNPLWGQTWESTRRGGHYMFQFTKQGRADPAPTD
jgi:hypothetical protein